MASRNLKTYDFKDVDLIVAGVKITGYGEGSGITVEWSAALAELIVGSDGEKTRVLSNDDTASITVQLAQTSSSNDLLSTFLRAKAATFPVAMQDNRGRTLLASKECFIGERPNIEFNAEMSEREWVIMIPFPEVWIGGSTDAGGFPALPSIPGVSLPF